MKSAVQSPAVGFPKCNYSKGSEKSVKSASRSLAAGRLDDCIRGLASLEKSAHRSLVVMLLNEDVKALAR